MKESQYRPESIRGKRPAPKDEVPPKSKQPQHDSHNPYDATTWDVIKSPFQGFFHGLLNTGLQYRPQMIRQKERVEKGLPPARYRRRWFFSRADNSSWFKEACDHKPMS